MILESLTTRGLSTAPALADRERLARRFLSYVDQSEPEGCWRWEGRRDAAGYGLIQVGKHGAPLTARATHVAWFFATGEFIPAGYGALHSCDNPPCVRFAHLFLGTPADNMADKMRKGRHRVLRGTATSMARLTEEDVRAIRASTDSYSTLACRFGVAVTTVFYVRHRRTWRHVE